MEAPKSRTSLEEVLVHRQQSMESNPSSPEQHDGALGLGRARAGRKAALLPTIQSAESLRGMDNSSSPTASQRRLHRGMRANASVTNSEGDVAANAAATEDLVPEASQDSDVSRVTHYGIDEDEPQSRGWGPASPHKGSHRAEFLSRLSPHLKGKHASDRLHCHKKQEDKQEEMADAKGHKQQNSGDDGEMDAKPLESEDDTASDATLADRQLEGFDSDEDDWGESGALRKTRLTRRWLWNVAAIIVSAAIFLSGIVLRILHPQTSAAGNVTAWRWVMFVGLLVPAYWVGEGLAQGLEAAIEWNFFENRRVLYYFIGTTRPLGRVFKTALLPVLWASIFRSQTHSSTAWEEAYTWILRILLCIFLFNVAIFVTTMLAKLLASYFQRKAFFDQMQTTLQQEHYLWALSRPRQNLPLVADSDDEDAVNFSGDEDDAADANRPGSPTANGHTFTADEGTDSFLHHRRRASDVTTPKATPFASSTATTPKATPFASSHATSPKATPFANSGRQMSKRAEGHSHTNSNVSGHASAALPSGRLSTGHRPDEHSNEPVTRHAAAAYRRRKAAVLQSVRDEKGTPLRSKGQGQEKMMEEAILQHPDIATDRLNARMEKIESRIRTQEFGATFDQQLAAAKQLKGEDRDKEAKRLAFYIFWNVKQDFSRNYIVQSDLRPFLSKVKAKAAFAYLDANNSGRVNQTEILSSVVQIFKDRRNLALALKGTRSVIGTLQAVIGIIVHIIFFFFYLLVLQISVDSMWITVSSGVLGFSFIFGNSIRSMFESILTLFVVHPFDIGDTLVIQGEFCIVEEASLTKIVLTRWDGARMWYPNELVNSQAITNVSRTDTQCQWFKVLVDVSTPSSACTHVREVLRSWAAERPADLKPDPAVGFWAPATDPMKVYLAVYFDWNFNAFEDRGRAAPIRHEMFLLISDILSELKVQYTLPSFGQPSTASDSTLPRGGALGQRSLLQPTSVDPVT